MAYHREPAGNTYEDERDYCLKNNREPPPSPEELERLVAEARRKKIQQQRESVGTDRQERVGKIAETVTTPKASRKWYRRTD